ncbi:Peptidase propeptide and YPEB domain protein [compost metagenome]
MIKQTIASVIATVALLGSGMALADHVGAGWISIDKAIEIARGKGYVEIHKVEADNSGYWEVEGHKGDKVNFEIRIDGKTGDVLRDQKD